MLAIPPVARADVEIEAAAWHYAVSGYSEDYGGRVDFKQYEVDGNTEPYVSLRYRQNRRGWWPDLALTYSRIKASGTHTVSEPGAIGPLVLLPGVTAKTGADVDDLTLGAAYTVLDSPVNISAGLAVRYLGGSILIRDSDAGTEDAQSIAEVFPLLSLSLRYAPLRRLALVADGAWIRAGSSTAYEFHAGVETGLLSDFYLQAGWMVKRYDVLSDDYRLNSRLDGARLGLLWRP